MSIRSFVTFSSLLLMAWLVLAFVHRPAIRGGLDPVTPDENLSLQHKDAENLAVSVSP